MISIVTQVNQYCNFTAAVDVASIAVDTSSMMAIC